MSHQDPLPPLMCMFSTNFVPCARYDFILSFLQQIWIFNLPEFFFTLLTMCETTKWKSMQAMIPTWVFNSARLSSANRAIYKVTHRYCEENKKTTFNWRTKKPILFTKWEENAVQGTIKIIRNGSLSQQYGGLGASRNSSIWSWQTIAIVISTQTFLEHISENPRTCAWLHSFLVPGSHKQ